MGKIHPCKIHQRGLIWIRFKVEVGWKKYIQKENLSAGCYGHCLGELQQGTHFFKYSWLSPAVLLSIVGISIFKNIFQIILSTYFDVTVCEQKRRASNEYYDAPHHHQDRFLSCAGQPKTQILRCFSGTPLLNKQQTTDNKIRQFTIVVKHNAFLL